MTDTYLPSDVLSRADWFMNDRFGMFIHWGLYAIPSVGEWGLQWPGIAYDQYRNFADRFNPEAFDAGEWAEIARDAGMRYMVFTTKHHDGFCMFDNPYTEWKITNSPFKRDVTRELADACRGRGMRMGFYHSLIDWMHPEYAICDNHPLWRDEQAKAQPRDQRKYIPYLHNSVRHLLSNYGKVDILWLDFTPAMKTADDWGAGELERLVRELQPRILIDDRLERHEPGQTGPRKFPGDFSSPEQVLPASPVTMEGKRRVWEACVTMNRHWGYVSEDQDYKPTRTLVHMLAHCVANDGNLLLNVGPDARGCIPAESITRLRQIGEWLRINGEAIYGAGIATDLTPPPGCLYTQNGNRLFLHVLDWPHMAVRLPGLKKRLKFASLLKDGSRVATVEWNSSDEDATLNLPFNEPDPLDTVVERELEG